MVGWSHRSQPGGRTGCTSSLDELAGGSGIVLTSPWYSTPHLDSGRALGRVTCTIRRVVPPRSTVNATRWPTANALTARETSCALATGLFADPHDQIAAERHLEPVVALDARAAAQARSSRRRIGLDLGDEGAPRGCAKPNVRAIPGVTSWVVIPTYAYETRPVRTSCSSARRAVSIGIAKPTPSAVPLVERIWALIPITRPLASNSGPPELPRLIGASI